MLHPVAFTPQISKLSFSKVICSTYDRLVFNVEFEIDACRVSWVLFLQIEFDHSDIEDTGIYEEIWYIEKN